MSGVSKINGIALANVAKVNNIDKANLGKVSGITVPSTTYVSANSDRDWETPLMFKLYTQQKYCQG